MTLSVCKPQVNRQWQSVANLQATDNVTISLQTTSQQTITECQFVKPQVNRQWQSVANLQATDNVTIRLQTTSQQTITECQFVKPQVNRWWQTISLQTFRQQTAAVGQSVCSWHEMADGHSHETGQTRPSGVPAVLKSAAFHTLCRTLMRDCTAHRTTRNDRFSSCLKRLVFHSVTLSTEQPETTISLVVWNV